MPGRLLSFVAPFCDLHSHSDTSLPKQAALPALNFTKLLLMGISHPGAVYMNRRGESSLYPAFSSFCPLPSGGTAD